MNRIYCILVVSILVPLLIVPQGGIATSITAALSGRVVDVSGTSVAGFGIALEPIPVERDEFVDDSEHQPNITVFATRTDNMGRFSIRNFPPIKFRLVSFTGSEHESAANYDIVSMKVGAMTVHQHEPSPFGGIAFAIKPDAHIENVEIRVKSHRHIRGRIVFNDGTPLVNESVTISASHYSLDGTGSGSSSSSGKTDADGYFAFHAEETGFYTVTVNYQGLSATVDPFLLEEGENKEDLVFAFDAEPLPSEASTGQIEVSAEASTSSLPGDMGAWVMNPANGHAYKRIRCESWDDANTQAIADGAHLVAINDAEEQEWILQTFKPHNCWIGLTDYGNEGEWVWSSGEPVDFTNWAPHEPKDVDRGDEDFVIIDFSGKWSDVGTDSIEWQMVRMAIIEKDGVTTTPSRKK